jgi:hypothetical protein
MGNAVFSYRAVFKNWLHGSKVLPRSSIDPLQNAREFLRLFYVECINLGTAGAEDQPSG